MDIESFDDVFRRVNDDVRKIENHCNYLKNVISRLEKRQETTRAFYTHRIVRDILKHICAGKNEAVAVGLVADEYDSSSLTYNDIQKIWNRAKREKNALRMYGRVFAAKKRRLSGFTLGDIACTLGLSKTSVQKLLKSNCDVD